MLLLVVCIALLFPGIDTSAATQKQQAMKAYDRWLSASKVYVLKKGERYLEYLGSQSYWANYTYTKASDVDFGIAYIDGDSVPELIVRGKVGNWISYGIITYKNGKLSRVFDDQGSLYGGCYYKTGYFIHLPDLEAYPYAFETEYYKMLGTNAVKRYSKYTTSYNKDSNFRLGNKSVTSSVFKKQLSSQTKNKKVTSIKYYKNTKANRVKILR